MQTTPSKTPIQQTGFSLLGKPFNAEWFCEAATKIIGRRYEVDEDNLQALKLLWDYFFNPAKFDADNPNYASGKGWLIIGNPGTGKTDLLKIFQKLVQRYPKIRFLSVKFWDVAGNYQAKGDAGIHHDRRHWLFDELGLERCREVKYYGQSVDIDNEIIRTRYEFFLAGAITHFTSNLDKNMLEERYDWRANSRLAQMCNVLVLAGKDRRKTARPRRNYEEEGENASMVDAQRNAQKNKEEILRYIQIAKETQQFPPSEYTLANWYDILEKENPLQISKAQRWQELLEARKTVYEQHNVSRVKILFQAQGKTKEWKIFQEKYKEEMQIKDNLFERLSITKAKANSIKKYYLET